MPREERKARAVLGPPRTSEERTLLRMRQNVRKSVRLTFKCYEVRIKAQMKTKTNSFEIIPPAFQLVYLRRDYIRDEIRHEVKKVVGAIEADCMIEIFAVYHQDTSIGEYHRYLGELDFVFYGLDVYDKAPAKYKNALAYFEQPEKRKFIPKRV